MEAVSIAARHPVDVLDSWQTNVRFLLVRDCLDVLIALLSHRSDPEIWVRELPHDWEVLYVATSPYRNRLSEQGATHTRPERV